MGCLVSSNETSYSQFVFQVFLLYEREIDWSVGNCLSPSIVYAMKVPKLQLRKLNDTENALLIDDKRFMQSLLKAFNGIDENDTNVGEKTIVLQLNSRPLLVHMLQRLAQDWHRRARV